MLESPRRSTCRRITAQKRFENPTGETLYEKRREAETKPGAHARGSSRVRTKRVALVRRREDGKSQMSCRLLFLLLLRVESRLCRVLEKKSYSSFCLLLFIVFSLSSPTSSQRRHSTGALVICSRQSVGKRRLIFQLDVEARCVFACSLARLGHCLA